MSKVTGQPIKFGAAQQLRSLAVGFQDNPIIKAAIANVDPATSTYFTNLDCAFVFDKDSLLLLISKIIADPDAGLIMIHGASTDTNRLNKPTLSIFACKIDKANDKYEVIHPNPADPNNTDGTEHPGIVSLKTGGVIDKGVIQFLTS